MSTDDRWGDRLTELNEVLAELYPTISESRRVVAGADLPASFIKFHDAAIVNWFNILDTARIRGRVEAIVEIAAMEFPRQERLTRLAGHSRRDNVRDGSQYRLTGSQQERLHDAMLAAFHIPANLTQMVRQKLGENLPAIAGTGNLSQQVFELIQWAESHGRLDELVAGAQKAVPGNADLNAFADDFARWKAESL